MLRKKIFACFYSIMKKTKNHQQNEVTPGRFLLGMEKNKGQLLNGKDETGNYRVSNETTAETPTVEEIVGSRDKSSLLHLYTRENNSSVLKRFTTVSRAKGEGSVPSSTYCRRQTSVTTSFAWVAVRPDHPETTCRVVPDLAAPQKGVPALGQLFFNSLIGMWEKGETLSLYRGVKGETSYSELERDTGRIPPI